MARAALLRASQSQPGVGKLSSLRVAQGGEFPHSVFAAAVAGIFDG